MALLINGVLGVLIILYPIAVYFGIQYMQPWKISALLLFILCIRFVISKFKARVDNCWNRHLLVLGIVYCVFAIWMNNTISLLFYPVLISFSLLMIFATSLFSPPPIIERLARLQHPNLPEQGIRYTRRVTQVWCVFFLINGCIALVTAIWCSFAVWSLYNGFISYLLMGAVMGIEYLVRIKTQVHLEEQVKGERRKAQSEKAVVSLLLCWLKKHRLL